MPKHHHKHHHKAHHKHGHKHHGSDSGSGSDWESGSGSGSDWDSDHKHHHADHKHHHEKKHHKHHHEKKHHKKHHHKHKHHHKKHHHKHHHSSGSEGSWESGSKSWDSKSHSSWESEEEYEAPPAPAEPKIEDLAVDEPEEAEGDDDGKKKYGYQQRLEEKKKKKKKKYGKKPSAATAPAMGQTAPAAAEEEEEDHGLSTLGKIGIGLGAGALALGAGAAGYHMKKKSDKKKEEKVAEAADVNAAVLRPDWATVEEVNSGSINLYPDLIYKPNHTVPAADHDVDNHCIEIKEACKGWGTDEERLIKALADECPELRTKIFYRFADMYNKDLEQLIDKECHGDFGTAMRLLTLPPDILDAKLVQMATRFGGTREHHLYPIVCGRSNADIDVLKKTYFKIFDKDLGSVIESEVHGSFEKLLFASIQGVEETFDASVHTAEKAKADAEAFFEAGQGGWGTKEKDLFKLLCFAPPEHLKAVNEAYADSYGYTLFKAFEKELTGVTEKAAIFTLGMKLKPYEFVARLIESACAGIGTDELFLTSVIVRYQKIMKEVMPVYEKLYGRTIQDRVRGEAKRLHEVVLLEALNAAA